MNKANMVFAVILNRRKKMQLLFERRSDGIWTLLGGEVRSNEQERDALLRHLYVEWLPNEVDVLWQLGGQHQCKDGRVAKVFVCTIDDPSGTPDGEMEGTFAQCAFVNRDEVTMDLCTECPTEDMIYDAFAIMEEPRRLPRQLPFTVEGIFTDPGRTHILVEETDDERLEWTRIDPSRPDGIMQPSG